MHHPRQQQFFHSLEEFSRRLDQLLTELRRYEPRLIPIELLDELAGTVGELTVALSDHLAAPHSRDLLRSVISHARDLRHDVRSQELPRERIAVAVGALGEEIERMIREDKRAA